MDAARRAPAALCGTRLLVRVADDDLRDAGILQRLELVKDERAVAKAEERKRLRQRQRPEAAREVADEQHSFHTPGRSFTLGPCSAG